MLLMIDSGNTNLKWAFAEKNQDLGNWHMQGSCKKIFLENLENCSKKFNIKKVLISNVSGKDYEKKIMSCLVKANINPRVINIFSSKKKYLGLNNCYENPSKLGSDRFASLIAAKHAYPKSTILVVNCGTATTIDILGNTGKHFGGLILPGISTMIESLSNKTANLNYIDNLKYKNLLANNTEDAIVSGCINSQIAIIQSIFLKYKIDYCLISGGAAKILTPFLNVLHIHINNLVLLGLHTSLILGEKT